MSYRLDKLGQYLRGWMGYFGISEYYRPIPELDEWLRRRVRMFYWKQWRRTRTKSGHLLALGGGQTHGDLDGHQQQELLAPVAVEGDAGGDDERLVEGTGPGEYP